MSKSTRAAGQSHSTDMEQQMRKSITLSDQAREAVAKADRAKANRRSLRANTVIIAAAVAYSQSAAAWRAGFAADPDGNNENASRFGARYARTRDSALQKLANTSASSAEALDAKARIVPMVLDDDCGDVADLSDEFYRAFAADVQKFLEPLVSAEWYARNDDRGPGGGTSPYPVQNPSRSHYGRRM